MGATTVGTGGDCSPTVPTLLGDQQCIVLVPQLFGRSFQKARNFTASIVTSQRDSVIPHQLLRRHFSRYSISDPLPHSPQARPLTGRVLGPKPWSPSTFQPWLRPCKVVLCSSSDKY